MSFTPRSLPEDSAILLHYSMHTNNLPAEHILDSDSPPGIPIRGGRPADAVSERTPLLQPPPNPEPILDNGNDNTTVDQTPISKMFREELRLLPQFALPILGSQLFEYSFIMASVISIGHISTVALAGAALASMTASVTGYSIVAGFVSALDTLLPPAWTSHTPHMVGLWSQRMALMMGLILIPMLAIWLNAETILLATNQEPEVARLAGVYLRCASLGLPAYIFNVLSRRYFQSQGLFTIPTRITLVVAPINVFLNWLFVYPLGLSFPGAPLATALSFNIVSATSIFYGYYFVPPTAWSPITWASLSPSSGEIWKGWGTLAKLGLAGVGQTASEWWCWELVALAASQLGAVTLAAQSVLLLTSSCTYQVPFALSIAASVRIGNLLGKGNAERASIAAKASIVMAIVMSSLLCTLLLVFRNDWGYIFNDDPEVVSLVASILPLVALFQVFDGMASTTGGIFRARGKQFMGAILNLSAYYVIGIPLGLYLGFVCGRALRGLWEGLMVALLYASAVGTWISICGVDWKKEVANAQQRVGGTKKDREGSV